MNLVQDREEIEIVVFDIPTYDRILPTKEELDAAYLLNSVSYQNQIKINEAYENIIKCVLGFDREGKDKYKYKKGEKKKLESLYKTFEEQVTPLCINMCSAGGNGLNKVSVMKPMLEKAGFKVKVKLVGAVGPNKEEQREELLYIMNSMGVELRDNGITTCSTKSPIIIPHQGDRIICREAIKINGVLYSEKHVLACMQEEGGSNIKKIYLFESKLKNHASGRVKDAIITELGKQQNAVIAFTPSPSGSLSDFQNKLLNTRRQKIISMNLEEFVGSFVDNQDILEIDGWGDERVISAEENINKLMKNGDIVIVTDGGNGSMAMIKRNKEIEKVYQKAISAKVVNTVGAGDNFCGVCLATIMSIRENKAMSDIRNFLEGMLQKAGRVAAVVVAQSGAQIPEKEVLENVLEGRVQTAGKFVLKTGKEILNIRG